MEYYNYTIRQKYYHILYDEIGGYTESLEKR